VTCFRAVAVVAKLSEPVKYWRNEKGNWVLTDEWKEWIKKRRAAESRPKPAKRSNKVTVENHKAAWREVAYHPDSGKRIYFCGCMSMHGDPYKGCGAVGIQQTRTSQIIEVKGSRFE